MVRLKIHKESKIIEKDDVVIISDEAIDKMQEMYPTINVSERLDIISQLFTYFPNTRAETKEELKIKLKNMLSKDNFITEEQLKANVGEDYVDIATIKSLERFGQ